MELHFVNRALSPEQRTQLNVYGNESFREGAKLFPGEYKTANELDLVTKTNQAIREMFRNFEIENLFAVIDPNSVHFLDEQHYLSVISQNDSFGQAFSVPESRIIIINREHEDHEDNGIVFTLLHEAIHLVACNTFFYDEENNKAFTKRMGFHTRTKSPLAKEVFVGFNEAIVDLTARMVQEQNVDLFFGANTSEAETKRTFGTYPDEIEVLDAIILGIASKKNQNPHEVWIRFCKAQFTGDITPLKEIEETFGRGSLKTLARLGHERFNPDLLKDEQKTIRNNILAHFKQHA